MRIMVFKNKYKERENQPDYTIYNSDGDELVKVGALWKGASAKAGDFFSGTIDDEDITAYEPETTEADDIPF